MAVLVSDVPLCSLMLSNGCLLDCAAQQCCIKH